MLMEHFRIYSEDDPQELPTATHFEYDEGNWRYYGNNIRVFALEDEGEPVEVWVAVKSRQAVIEEAKPSMTSRFIPVQLLSSAA